MTRIYRVDIDFEQYPSIYIPSDILVKVMEGQKAGASLKATWKDVSGSLEQLKPDAEGNTTPDISKWSHHIVFSESAYSLIAKDLDAYGEFLPVDINGSTWQVFNVLNMLDVDQEKSEATVIDGVNMGVESIEFSNVDENNMIFKTPFDRFIGTYCTDKFQQLVESKKLSGLTFFEELVDEYG